MFEIVYFLIKTFIICFFYYQFENKFEKLGVLSLFTVREREKNLIISNDSLLISLVVGYNCLHPKLIHYFESWFNNPASPLAASINPRYAGKISFPFTYSLMIVHF